MALPETASQTEINDFEMVYWVWYYHLFIVFISIIVFRSIGSCLCASIPKIANHVIPKCRARRAIYEKNAKEINEYRRQMAALNMVDNFAAYSKIQRKLQTLSRSQHASERSQLETTVVFNVAAQCLRFLIHGVLMAYLFYRAPTVRLTRDAVNQTAASLDAAFYPPMGWLLVALHSIPNWMINSVWIALSDGTAAFLVNRVTRKCFAGPTPTAATINDAS